MEQEERKTLRSRIFEFIAYSGVDKKTYKALSSDIDNTNRKSLYILSFLGLADGLLMSIVTFLNNGAIATKAVYLSALVYSLLLLVFLRLKKVSQRHFVLVIVSYFSLIATFVYGGVLAFYRPAPNDVLAVTFNVVLVAFPLLFIVPNWIMWLLIILADCGFILCTFFFNSPDVRSINILNAGSFGIVSIVFYTLIANIRISQLAGRLRRYEDARKLVDAQSQMVFALSDVIESRDGETGDHVNRTQRYVENLLSYIRKDPEYRGLLTDDYIFHVVRAAPLHDIGKIKIKDEILNKPGKLTKEEFEQIKLHTVYGAEIIDHTISKISNQDFLPIARNIALYHHEWYDGTGYPEHKKGNDIPFEARVMALADVYDALVSKRCYKEAYPKEEALEIIKEEEGSHFDPKLVDYFIEMMSEETEDQVS